MDEIKEYMRWRKLPRDLVVRMRRYYTYFYQKKTAFDEKTILGNLTPTLRLEVVEHTLKESVGKISLFSNKVNPAFQMQVFPLLTPLHAGAKEVIFTKGSASQALYFLIKGQVEVVSGVDDRVLYRIRAGCFFGESVLTGRRRAAEHRASTMCEMLYISDTDLKQLFVKYPREGRLIHKTVMAEHRNKERIRLLALRMLINRILTHHSAFHELSDDFKERTVAALRMQIAWAKYCDREIMSIAGFDDDDAESNDEVRSLAAGAVLMPGDPPPSPPRSPTRSPTRQSMKAAVAKENPPLSSSDAQQQQQQQQQQQRQAASAEAASLASSAPSSKGWSRYFSSSPGP